MAHFFLSAELNKLLGNNTHTIENSIVSEDKIFFSITCSKPIGDIQLEKISFFLQELLHNNTISGFSKTETSELIMFQIIINN